MLIPIRMSGPYASDRAGAADEVSLHEVDADPAQDLQGLLVLDTLGDGLQVEGVGQRDDPTDQRVVARVARQVADERHVDLQVPDREVLEVGQRRVPGPKSSSAKLQPLATRWSANRTAWMRSDISAVSVISSV